jgi:hypothetical protein
LFAFKRKLGKILLGSCIEILAVFSFVLAMNGSYLELLDLGVVDRVVANEFVQIASVPTQVSPGKDLFSTFSNLGSEMQAFVKQECLLVALSSQGSKFWIFTVLVLCKIFFAFFVCPLYDELVLEVLVRSSDSRSGVLEDEL